MSSKDLLILSFLTFITVVAWIIFDIHHEMTASTITPVQQELMKPLKPGFDQEVILNLRERKGLE